VRRAENDFFALFVLAQEKILIIFENKTIL